MPHERCQGGNFPALFAQVGGSWEGWEPALLSDLMYLYLRHGHVARSIF